ncbi:MAG: hypothetical protein HY327_00410 [Chloroflexi bacterium]|nr:hypothetical protein [Chloroflexota bacterium]
MNNPNQRIAIYYEHPEWFKPLFAEMDRRDIVYDRLLADAHWFDPHARRAPYALVVNRMSPSAYLRGHAHAIFYTRQYLAHLQALGANVVNGYDAYRLETSKALQLELLERLGLRYPRANVINHPAQAVAAARDLTYPIVIKPNIGGSGAKIRRFDSPNELSDAVAREDLDLGIDHTALAQEYHAPRDGHIVRVEMLDNRFLYAIKVYPKPEEGFNLCPADFCRPDEKPVALDLEACPVDSVQKLGLRVEAATPPRAVIEDVTRIVRAAQIDVGGIEYLVSERDGQTYYYDINALSNFVTDAPNVIGFDPFPVFVDYLLERAGITQESRVGLESFAIA